MRVRPGFTLVELMLVIVLLGILMLIAIPQFLGNTSKVQDARTKLSVTNVSHSVHAFYSESGSFKDDTSQSFGDTASLIAYLEKDQPDYEFTASPIGPGDEYDTVYVRVDDDGQTATVCAYSESRRYFCWRESPTHKLRIE